jgi:hypothetical protein
MDSRLSIALCSSWFVVDIFSYSRFLGNLASLDHSDSTNVERRHAICDLIQSKSPNFSLGASGLVFLCRLYLETLVCLHVLWLHGLDNQSQYRSDSNHNDSS